MYYIISRGTIVKVIRTADIFDEQFMTEHCFVLGIPSNMIPTELHHYQLMQLCNNTIHSNSSLQTQDHNLIRRHYDILIRIHICVHFSSREYASIM